MRRPRTVLAMDPSFRDDLLSSGGRERLVRLTSADPELVITDFADSAHADALAGAEVLFTSWGCPPLTGEVLTRMPELRAIVHAAGTIKHHVTDACWERGIAVATAAGANAVPVAEYTLAAILFGGKHVLRSAHLLRDARGFINPHQVAEGNGNYRRKVGIVGASRVGRLVIELLRPFDMDVLVHDPYLGEDLGARLVPLDELVESCDVVSIHAPELPETYHMFDRRRLALMRDGATLINTARGSLVDTEALTEELVSGRIHAILDVTDPDVLSAGSVLYDLPNVLLTPHIAGSVGNELARLAHAALDELERYAQGRPFNDAVRPDLLSRLA